MFCVCWGLSIFISRKYLFGLRNLSFFPYYLLLETATQAEKNKRILSTHQTFQTRETAHIHKKSVFFFQSYTTHLTPKKEKKMLDGRGYTIKGQPNQKQSQCEKKRYCYDFASSNMLNTDLLLFIFSSSQVSQSFLVSNYYTYVLDVYVSRTQSKSTHTPYTVHKVCTQRDRKGKGENKNHRNVWRWQTATAAGAIWTQQ